MDAASSSPLTGPVPGPVLRAHDAPRPGMGLRHGAATTRSATGRDPEAELDAPLVVELAPVRLDHLPRANVVLVAGDQDGVDAQPGGDRECAREHGDRKSTRLNS